MALDRPPLGLSQVSPDSPPQRARRRLRVLPQLALGAAVLMLVLSPAHAQWKWRDANGRVQLSDLPPPASVPDKDILQRPRAPRTEIVPAGAATAAAAASAPAAAGPAASGANAAKPKTALDAEVERKRKADEQEKLAKSKADEERRQAQRADNCQRARQMVATIDSGQRISRVNDKGEREFLDDQQRGAEAQRARSIMSSDCR